MTPAESHSIGPSCAKKALTSPKKISPQKAANPILNIADPGNAKATGKPSPSAIIINMNKRNKK